MEKCTSGQRYYWDWDATGYHLHWNEKQAFDCDFTKSEHKENNTRPNIEPWGTPQIIYASIYLFVLSIQ